MKLLSPTEIQKRAIRYLPKNVLEETFWRDNKIYKTWPELPVDFLEGEGRLKIKRYRKDINNPTSIQFFIEEPDGVKNPSTLRFSKSALTTLLGENHAILWDELVSKPESRAWIFEAAFLVICSDLQSTFDLKFIFESIEEEKQKRLNKNKFVTIGLELNSSDHSRHYMELFLRKEFLDRQLVKFDSPNLRYNEALSGLMRKLPIALSIIVGRSSLPAQIIPQINVGDYLKITETGIHSNKLLLKVHHKKQYMCLFKDNASGGPMTIEIKEEAKYLNKTVNTDQDNYANDDTSNTPDLGNDEDVRTLDDETVANLDENKEKPEIYSTDIKDIPIRLVFQLGTVNLSLEKVTEIVPGQGFLLDSGLDSPITILANDCNVGKGNLVQIGETLGVEITEWYQNV